MGLTWAAAWAVAGVLIGAASNLLPFLPWDAFFDVFDAPLPALAIPGFFGGALFSTVLGIAGRSRRFDELSVPRFAAWGALGGLLLSLLPNALVAVGLADLGSADASLWKATAVIAGPFILLSSLSAAGSLMLARRALDTGARDSVEHSGERSLAEGESSVLLGETTQALDPDAAKSRRNDRHSA
jgi:hypothetical protein